MRTVVFVFISHPKHMHKSLIKYIAHCSHSGKDSCFTTMSTTLYRMDYDAKSALTSSDCASECITSSNCGAVYVTAGNSCSKLQYNNGLPSRLLASHLAYTHYYHRSMCFRLKRKRLNLHRIFKLRGMPGHLVLT